MADATPQVTLDDLPVTAKALTGPTIPPGGSYQKRAITVTFQLGKGSFGDSGFDQLTLSGLRVEAELDGVGMSSVGLGATQAIVRIYGMTLDHINKLTYAGLQYADRNDLMAIQAGDAASGMHLVFNGHIISAFPDFSQMPDVGFVVSALTSFGVNMKTVPATSFPGAVNASDIFSKLASNAGFAFENNGVIAKLTNTYLPGTTGQQIASVARAANVYAYLDGVKKTLAVWPKSGHRAGDILLFSAETGMIEYPSFSGNNVNIIVRALFNPALEFGQQIRVKSALTAANGLWDVIYLKHILTSELPGGPWEMIITCNAPKAPNG